MLKYYLEKLITGQNLTVQECEQATNAMLNGANPHQIAAFLVLLRAKGETADEIFGIIKALRKHMQKVHIKYPVLDIVGTGGDKSNTVNISTGASILAASCGVKVVKHGNRSVSSQCGSADVLEALGLKIDMNPKQVAECVAKIGFGFCFAPNFHPAFKEIKPIRKALAIPTCFNILGPLLNPAQAEYLMIGVFNEDLLDLMADVLLRLNVKHALVFHSAGTDELSCIAPAKVIEVKSGKKDAFILDAQQYGFAKCSLKDLQGGSAQHNAKLLQQVFAGKKDPIADTIIFNAAVALYIYGITTSIEKAIPIVKENIKNGNAMKILTTCCRGRPPCLPVSKPPCLPILNKIIEKKQQEVATLKPNKKSFKQALLNDRAVIAEIKRKSPSKGSIAKIDDPIKLAKEYVACGANAISVLTDKDFFGGSLDDLKKVSKAVSCPVLRKDFIIDPIQIAEAVAAGADAVLLIVAVLQDKTKELLRAAKAMNIDALVEVHNQEELELAVTAGAEIIGVNNRNLKTFQVDINNSLELVSLFPKNVVKVSESGIDSPATASKLFQAGFNAVLIGESLVRAENPEEFIKEMRAG